MTVYFANKHPFDRTILHYRGISVKITENPFGEFGTGISYAIPIFLRTGHTITLTITPDDGVPIPEVYEFTIGQVTVRDTLHDVVCINGETLPIAIHNGEHWEPWQAYREMATNAMDEVNHVITDDIERLHPDHGTIFAIDGPLIHNLYNAHDDVFLDMGNARLINEGCDGDCDIIEGASPYVYYKGVRAHELDMSSIYTYNIKSKRLKLTEDRTVDSIYAMRSFVSTAIMHLDESHMHDFVNIMFAPELSFEASVNYSNCYRPKPHIMEWLKAHRHNVHVNQTAWSLWKEYADMSEVHSTVTLSRADMGLFADAIVLLGPLSCTIKLDDIIVVESLGAEVFGLVRDEQMFISKGAFDLGVRFLASTLYEEWLHKELRLRDHTRQMQNHLFDKLLAFADKLRYYEQMDAPVRADNPTAVEVWNQQLAERSATSFDPSAEAVPVYMEDEPVIKRPYPVVTPSGSS